MSTTSEKNDISSYQEEIRFVKDQQWKPVYYPLLLFSAIIIIFSKKIIDIANPYYSQLKFLAIALIILVGIVSIIWQWLHFKALQDYRKTPLIGRKTSKTVVSVMITITFNVITLFGTAFVFLYLLT